MRETRTRARREKFSRSRRGQAEEPAPASSNVRTTVCVSLALVGGALMVAQAYSGGAKVVLTQTSEKMSALAGSPGSNLRPGSQAAAAGLQVADEQRAAAQRAAEVAAEAEASERKAEAAKAEAEAAAAAEEKAAEEARAAAAKAEAEAAAKAKADAEAIAAQAKAAEAAKAAVAVAPEGTAAAAPSPPPGEVKSCISFVHIPKAAGSNVEGVIARAFGYNQVVENPGDCISMRKIEKEVRFWGMCDDRLTCETKKNCGFSGADCCYVNKSFRPVPSKHTATDRCSFWHFPPAFDPVLAESYSGPCDAFCVVREPMSRFMSHWRWRWLSKTGCNTQALEKFAKEKLEQAKEFPLLEDCHFTPQVYYAFQNGDPSAPRICRHIIKLEEIKDHFAPLMKLYNLEKVKLKGHSRSSQKCDVKPSAETVRLVKEFYAQDYKAFGYSI